MSVYFDYDEGDWDDERQHYRSGRKYGKPMGHGAPHLPNKAERKELARIMQASGMTEEEVREDITHRRALAKASKSMSPPSDHAHRARLRMKQSAKRLAHIEGIPIWEAQKKVGMR
jgi:hypothetical protein